MLIMSDEEDLPLYGTPLETLTKDNIHLAKAKKVSDQIVTDKHGRQRFHGAFTGGFSAGYFNSVGSKEGWTPSTFVSSRSKRAENVSFDPTQFMDEEDMDHFGIAHRQIQPTRDFDDASRQSKKKVQPGIGPIPGQPVLQDLLKPANLTIGMQLLMKLGWKPGQGIGPRLTSHDKKRAKQKKSFYSSGNFLDDQVDEGELEGNCEDDPNLLFAPDDNDAPLLSTPKADLFGLGYKPLDRRNVLGNLPFSDNSSTLRIREKNAKMSFRGQAFGVGAFEDDDDEIYGNEDMSKYDFTLGPEADRSKGNNSAHWQQQISTIGRILEGFKLSSTPLSRAKSYPLPVLPSGFQPSHKSYRRRFERKEGENNAGDRISLEERRRLTSNPPSVEVRSGVKGVKPPDNIGSSSKNVDPEVSFKNTFSELPSAKDELNSHLSTSGHVPFASWPDKQRRYEAFLRVKGNSDLEASVFPSSMTEWEKQREKEEFFRASRIVKPLSFSMASRFTPAVHDEISEELKEGLNKMAKGSYRTTSSVSSSNYETSEEVKMAKAKMFGRFTRASLDWVPHNLLCKRFNVPNPFPGSSKVGVPGQSKAKASIFDFMSLDLGPNRPPVPEMSLKEEEPLSSNGEIENKGDVPSENYGLKVPVTNPPTMDLFKAIFQDSSDSESEENQSQTQTSLVEASDEPLEKTEKEQSSPVKLKIEPSVDSSSIISQRPNSPFSQAPPTSGSHSTSNPGNEDKTSSLLLPKASGVFKGIDFKTLNEYRVRTNESRKAVVDLTSESPTEASGSKRKLDSCSSSSGDEASEDDFKDDYVPCLPPHLRHKSSSEHKTSVDQKLMLLKQMRELLETKSKKPKKNKKERKGKKRKRKKEKKKKSKR